MYCDNICMYNTVSVTFISLAPVRVQKKYRVPRILHASSSRKFRYFHTSCIRSETFHAVSSSFHVQAKNSTLGEKSILAKA